MCDVISLVTEFMAMFGTPNPNPNPNSNHNPKPNSNHNPNWWGKVDVLAEHTTHERVDEYCKDLFDEALSGTLMNSGELEKDIQSIDTVRDMLAIPEKDLQCIDTVRETRDAGEGMTREELGKEVESEPNPNSNPDFFKPNPYPNLSWGRR